MSISTHRRRGAYGFRVLGLERFDPLLVEAAEDWPQLEITWIEDGTLDPPSEAGRSTVRFTPGGARIELGRSGLIEIEREPRHVRITSRSVANGKAVLHPYLGAAASVLARWCGRESFHAGACVVDGAAWGVLGGRTAGKSSLLAALHLRGLPVVADDVLVVEGGHVLAAPRSLDLRLEAAERLGVGRATGIAGARERWRVELPPIAATTPLAGFVHLDWGESSEARVLRGSERLARLRSQLTIPGEPVDPTTLLELATLPSFELRRPRDWAAVDAGVDDLLGLLRRG